MRYRFISSSVMSVGSPPNFVLAIDGDRRGGSKPCFFCILCQFSTVIRTGFTASGFGASSAFNGSGSAFSHRRHMASLLAKWFAAKNNKSKEAGAEKRSCGMRRLHNYSKGLQMEKSGVTRRLQRNVLQ